MVHKDKYLKNRREHHPAVSTGLFFILLGVALLIAMNDMLHLGSVKEYFTPWTAMVFIGVLLLLNLQFIGGLLLIAGGAWFLMEHYYGVMPDMIKTFYWPGVIVVLGLSFIISSFFRRNRLNN
jgi:Domain of unknown function (DUF5668)